MICTYVARTNVARTNVTYQLISVLDVPRNLSLKFGHNRSTNSRDITDIEFGVGG